MLIAVKVYAQTDWTADPDCLWALTMDETSGNLMDLCGTFDGDMSGTGQEAPPTPTSGKFFGGMHFGTTGFVGMGDVTFFDGRDHLTWSFWLKTASDMSAGDEEIVRKDGTWNIQNTSGVERTYTWTSVNPSGVAFNVATSNYPTDYWFSEDGTWHMYTVTYDGTTIKGYRDCNLINSQGKTGTFSNTVNPLSLGRRGTTEGSGPVYVYSGDMDDVIVLGRALDTTECTELMTWGIDGSGGFNQAQEQMFNVEMFNVEVGGGT